MITKVGSRLLALGAAVLLASAPAVAQNPPPPPGSAPGPHRAAPRVLVLTFGRGDQNRDEQAAKIQGIAEEVLLAYRFPLVDEQQLMASYQINDLEKFVVLSPERARLAELKARFGCELICVVQFTRTFMYEKDFFGAHSRFYKTDVRVKGILPDTAEIVSSSGDETTIEARTTGMEALTREHVKRLAERVLERWSHEAFGTIELQVVAKGFDHALLTRLENAVRGFPNVMELNERSFNGKADEPGSAMFEVKFNGAPEELHQLLVNCPDPAVDVVASTPNRIEVVPVARRKVGLNFVAPPEGTVVGGKDEAVQVWLACSDPQAAVDVNGVAAQRDPQSGNFGVLLARTALAPGANTLLARARSGDGQTAEARRTLVLASPPTVAIVSPRGGVTNRRPVEVIVDARSDLGAPDVQVNGVRAEPTQDGHFRAMVALADGDAEIVATASDAAGQAYDRVTIKVDTVPPMIDGKVVAIIEGRVDKAGTIVTCDGKPVQVNADGTFRITVEAVPGSSVTVVAVDPAGNRSEKVYPIGGPTTR
jgi:hypothetical protein